MFVTVAKICWRKPRLSQMITCPRHPSGALAESMVPPGPAARLTACGRRTCWRSCRSLQGDPRPRLPIPKGAAGRLACTCAEPT